MNQKLNSLNTQLTSTNDKLNEANTALQETNSSLFESNKIKNIYIMEFMNKCSAYIDKLDAYRCSLNKLAANGGLQELYRRLQVPSWRMKSKSSLRTSTVSSSESFQSLLCPSMV